MNRPNLKTVCNIFVQMTDEWNHPFELIFKARFQLKIKLTKAIPFFNVYLHTYENKFGPLSHKWKTRVDNRWRSSRLHEAADASAICEQKDQN